MHAGTVQGGAAVGPVGPAGPVGPVPIGPLGGPTGAVVWVPGVTVGGRRGAGPGCSASPELGAAAADAEGRRGGVGDANRAGEDVTLDLSAPDGP